MCENMQNIAYFTYKIGNLGVRYKYEWNARKCAKNIAYFTYKIVDYMCKYLRISGIKIREWNARKYAKILQILPIKMAVFNFK